ncbi:hypothetical protein SEVIR_9G510500v4 [Setaria viridis]
MESWQFSQGVHPNTSKLAIEPMASEASVPKREGFADLVLQGPEPPSLWYELIGMLRKAVRYRSADKHFTLSVCAMSILHSLFPILEWSKSYSLKSFRSDVMAGLTLASLSIPQSIGYANLAKLDPQYGLYTSAVPPLVYAVMGTSREIAIGPVAVVSLLLSSMVQKIADPAIDLASYRKMIFTVTFLTGVFQFAFGLLRLGFLVDFLSHAAITGFMGGAAIVIGLQQLKGLLGLSHFTSNTDIVSVTRAVWVSVHEPWHPENFFIGCSFFLFILGMRFIEAIAVGRSFSVINGYKLDGNKEMVAMGFMNVAGSLSSCYVATGSFSRTAVNFTAGCKTAVSNVVMAATVMVALELLMKLLFYTPVSILASIILSALPGLINVHEICILWKVDKMDFLTCMGSFLGVLFGSVEIGLSVAVWLLVQAHLYCFDFDSQKFIPPMEYILQVGVSFAKVIVHSVRPQVQILGRLRGTNIFCNIKQYPMVCQTPAVLTTRIDTSFLCFINANFIRERITGWVTEKLEEIRSVVLDMSNVVNIDTAGLAALEELHKELVSRGIQVHALILSHFDFCRKMMQYNHSILLHLLRTTMCRWL